MALLDRDLEKLLEDVTATLAERTSKDRAAFIMMLTSNVVIHEKETGGQEAALRMAGELMEMTKMIGLNVAEPH